MVNLKIGVEMKRLTILLICLVFGAVHLFAQCFEAACIPREIKETCTVDKSTGCIDWTNGILYAAGLGVPNKKFEDPAQRHAMALRAAKLEGMRNLLEMLEGVHITSSTTVKEGMLNNDVIETQIRGKLKNVVQAGQKTMGNGSIWITVKMYMKDIRPILLEGVRKRESDTWHADSGQAQVEERPVREETAVEETAVESSEMHYGGSIDTIYTGLVVDARGTGVVPALAPKIYSETGREVYGSAAIDREFALKFGIVGYAKDLEKVKSDDRVKGNILFLKARGLFGGQNSDLKIAEEDAELISQLDRSQSFLREARVMILVD